MSIIPWARVLDWIKRSKLRSTMLAFVCKRSVNSLSSCWHPWLPHYDGQHPHTVSLNDFLSLRWLYQVFHHSSEESGWCKRLNKSWKRWTAETENQHLPMHPETITSGIVTDFPLLLQFWKMEKCGSCTFLAWNLRVLFFVAVDTPHTRRSFLPEPRYCSSPEHGESAHTSL